MPNSIIPSLTKSKNNQQIDGYINKNKYDNRQEFYCFWWKLCLFLFVPRLLLLFFVIEKGVS